MWSIKFETCDSSKFINKRLNMSLMILNRKLLFNIGITNIGITNIGITNIGITNIGITNIGITNIGITNTIIRQFNDKTDNLQLVNNKKEIKPGYRPKMTDLEIKRMIINIQNMLDRHYLIWKKTTSK